MRNIIRVIFVFVYVLYIQCSPAKNHQSPDENMRFPLDAGIFNISYVTGKFDPDTHKEFREVDEKFADRTGLFLHKQTYDAFGRMWSAARADSIFLVIRSASRNFVYQKGIWERKWNGTTVLSDGSKAPELTEPVERARKILLYSAMPGTSRHHWGTDLDLNNFNNSYFEYGEGQRIYQWLKKNAARFGFCQPYTDKRAGRTGYEEEKWHWSYFPISSFLTSFSEENLTNEMISGFLGDQTAIEIDVVKNYILGVSMLCNRSAKIGLSE